MPKLPGKIFTLKSTLESLGRPLAHTAVFLPPAMVKNLPQGRVRVEGFLNETPFALAVQFKKDGQRFLLIGGTLRRAAKVKVGDPVTVRFKVVDPDKLTLPEELEAVLAQDEEGQKAWNALTTGLQRSLAYYVNSAKNIDNRIQRALQMVNKAKTEMLQAGAAKKATRKPRPKDVE